MTPLDEAIEELTAMTRLGAIPEQQRRILGDVIGKIRMHRNEVADAHREALKEMIDCTLDEVCGPSVTLSALRQFAHKLKEEFFEETA